MRLFERAPAPAEGRRTAGACRANRRRGWRPVPQTGRVSPWARIEPDRARRRLPDPRHGVVQRAGPGYRHRLDPGVAAVAFDHLRAHERLVPGEGIAGGRLRYLGEDL